MLTEDYLAKKLKELGIEVGHAVRDKWGIEFFVDHRRYFVSFRRYNVNPDEDDFWREVVGLVKGELW